MVQLLMGLAIYALITACNTDAQMVYAPNGERYLYQPFFDDFDGTTVHPVTWLVATWAEHGGQCGKERCFVQDGIFNYYLSRGSEVVLGLFTVSGCHIDRIRRTHLAAGAYRIDLKNIIDAPGVFISTLVANNGETTQKWVMAK